MNCCLPACLEDQLSSRQTSLTRKNMHSRRHMQMKQSLNTPSRNFDRKYPRHTYKNRSCRKGQKSSLSPRWTCTSYTESGRPTRSNGSPPPRQQPPPTGPHTRRLWRQGSACGRGSSGGGGQRRPRQRCRYERRHTRPEANLPLS